VERSVSFEAGGGVGGEEPVSSVEGVRSGALTKHMKEGGDCQRSLFVKYLWSFVDFICSVRHRS